MDRQARGDLADRGFGINQVVKEKIFLSPFLDVDNWDVN